MTNSYSGKCANVLCRQPLGADPVVLVTTGHVRRFCNVECIHVGHAALMVSLFLEVDGRKFEDEAELRREAARLIRRWADLVEDGTW